MSKIGNFKQLLKSRVVRCVSVIDRLIGPRLRFGTASQLSRETHQGIDRRVCEVIDDSYAGVVGSGPFSQMVILDQVSWGKGSDRAPKLLGCYEQELHAAIKDFVALRPRCVVNIGCAEGYYAVGLARRLPGSRVAAVDLDEVALMACDAAATANNVSEQVTTMLPDELDASWTEVEGALFVVDVEGAEVEILDLNRMPALRSAMVIVECHDFKRAHITAELQSRFADTHHIENVRQSGRNPGQFAVLRDRPESERWAAVNEHRPCVMNWLVMTPNSGAN